MARPIADMRELDEMAIVGSRLNMRTRTTGVTGERQPEAARGGNREKQGGGEQERGETRDGNEATWRAPLWWTREGEKDNAREYRHNSRTVEHKQRET